MISEQEIVDMIRCRLSDRRFRHSLGVAQAAWDLAGHYGQNKEKAKLIGLLHDFAKGMSGLDLIKVAGENQLIGSEIDRQLPDLLHAPVGAVLVRQELGIEDRGILNAIRFHTMGDVAMSLMDKIIFLADMIEPGRDYPGLERLKCLAYRDLDEAMLFGLESTIKYCLEQKRLLHPQTITVRNYFLQCLKETGHGGC